jgi:hypothetical protein
MLWQRFSAPEQLTDRTTETPMLTDEQKHRFATDGVLVLADFFSVDACAVLRDRMAALVADFDPTEASTVFSTTDRSHSRDDWFLESGDKIRFFLEEDAFDADGTPTGPLPEVLNKVGPPRGHDRHARPPRRAAPPLVGAQHLPTSRHAYTLHIIEGDAHYPADSWLQRSPTMPLRGFDQGR